MAANEPTLARGAIGLATTRTWFAMSRIGLLPSPLARLHPKWRPARGHPHEAATPLLALHGGPGFTHGPSEFTVTGTLKTWDIMDRLAEIRIPTLLVGGRHDECTPGHMHAMRARIPGSQLETIQDASHLCFAERPAEFNKIINSFLAERTVVSLPSKCVI
jgi:pimeloyl-ACP methyl ester carboxylesterase